MNSTAGTGALLSKGEEVIVEYDLVELSGHSGVFAEGEVFGDTHALFKVFQSGPCVLRLESGDPVHAYLEDCRSSAGVADIRITDPVKWP